jgi:nicotinamidase-related amidase/alkylated DNA repair dioxygenase AlkB
MSPSALLIIDAQNQFLCADTGGTFAKKHRPVAEVVHAIKRAVTHARTQGDLIIWITSEYGGVASAAASATNAPLDIRTDTHRGRTPCCVAGSEAAKLYPAIAALVQPETDVCITKHWYSAFRETNLQEHHLANVEHVTMCGVHTNVCVLATALDARLILPPTTTVSVIEPATSAFTAVKHERALDRMREAGIDVCASISNDESFGAGDSFLIRDFLPSRATADEAFTQLFAGDNNMWARMQHRGSEVPRLVSMQACLTTDSQGHARIPVYRHPADEQPEPRPFVSCLEQARQQLNERFAQLFTTTQQGAVEAISFNHAIVQQYRGGTDSISQHVDKTIDIVQGTPICNLSLGAQRTMILRHKTQAGLVQRIPLPHNSLFVMGWHTNREWQVSIAKGVSLTRPNGTRTPQITIIR